MRVYKRDDSESWQAEWYDAEGRRYQRSTRCRDRRAAEAVARQWEQDAADPARAAALRTTLNDALELLLAQRDELVTAGHRSAETVKFYERKTGQLVRVLGADTPIAKISAALIDHYVSTRRSHFANKKHTRKVSDHTIVKELTALRAALKLCKRRGLWAGDIDAIMPLAAEVSTKYKPRERWLAWHELRRLLAELEADRAARVAFIVATGARWSESERAERADITDERVLLRGTKTEKSWRYVPVVAIEQRQLLALALEQAQGEGTRMLGRWHNVNRDLKEACERAKIPGCSPNDLRRTFGTYLRASGASVDTVGEMLGHVDEAMAKRVYARLDPSQLAQRVTAEMGGAVPPASSFETVTHTSQPARDGADKTDDADGRKREGETKNRSGAAVSWCRRSDLNQRPWDYDSPALTS